MSSEWSSQNTTEALENNDYRLHRLFDGYIFKIPKYQRFYSWRKPQWEDLWDDLLNIIDEKGPDHYMGTVICKDEENSISTEEYSTDYREYSIVDGQQRFTTLVLLLKSIVSNYESIDSEKLSEEAREKHQMLPVGKSKKLFVLDNDMEANIDGYEERNKLKLQREDNETFKDILREDIDETTVSTPSQARLVEAYEFYQERMDNLRREHSQVGFLHQIGQLLKGIKSLRFMAYTISDSAEATLIFESINDRGKGLSNLDKTKSFLMHKVYLTQSEENTSEITIDGVQRRFGRIYRRLQNIETKDRTSGISEDQIQRYHYISTVDKSVNRKYIKSETDRRNRNLPSGGSVYLGSLKWHFSNLHKETDIQAYQSYPRSCIEEINWYTDGLSRYYSHMEKIASYGKEGEYNSNIDWEIRKLFALDRLGNFYPLLLSLWDEYVEGCLTTEELHEILQLIEVASFRVYTTVTRSDTGQPDFYNLANELARSDRDADWLVKKLQDKIQSHENDFEGVLRDTNAYHRIRYKDLRYLLYSYELYLRHEGRGGGESSIEKAAENAGNDYTLDHIWPNDTSELNLTEEEEKIHEDIKDSLGNLTLTTGPRNSEWKNQPYHKKRKRKEENKQDYLNSDFALTRKVARENKTWGQNQIETRLDEIIEFANRRWSLDVNEREPLATIRPSEVE